jgi:actin-like ATPase involved in cell morphogenesis
VKIVNNFISNFRGQLTAKKDILLLDFGSGNTKLYDQERLISSKNSSLLEFNNNRYQKVHLVDHGTITNFDLAVSFLNTFLQDLVKSREISSRFTGYYLTPIGLTQVEELIVKKVLASLKYGTWKLAKKREFYNTSAGLVFDIGFDSTEVVLGVSSKSAEAKTIKFGSSAFTHTIRKIVRDKHQLELSWLSAEKIKKEIAGEDFLLSVNMSKQKITARGKDIYTFVPKTVVIDAKIFQEPLLERVEELFEEIKLFFSKISTNHLMNSIEEGLELWGEGAKLAGMGQFFSKKLQTKVKVAQPSYEVPK